MSAKKLVLAALITSMLNACGGGATQAPLPADGEITPPAASDDYSSGGDFSGGEDPYASDSGSEDPTGTGTTLPADGFTLKGIVVDKQTKAPLKGATVTIGSSTQLTGDDGTFEIKEIMDTQVWVNVSKDGFQAIKQENITFSEDKPTADKEFALAATGASNDADDDEDEDTDEGARFKHLATYGEGKFKSVTAMAVDGDTLYVLGLVDKLLLDSVAVVAYDLGSGSEIRSFRNVGFLKNLPKNATYMKVDDGEVYVSNGEEAWVFNGTGTFLRKAGGASYPPIKEVEDDDKNRTYSIESSSKIHVERSGDDPTLDLDEAGSLKAIALGPDHTLVVLDGSNGVVHTYEYED